MTKAHRYRLASGVTSTASAVTLLLRSSLPTGPADFTAGFLIALSVAFLFSGYVTAEPAE